MTAIFRIELPSLPEGTLAVDDLDYETGGALPASVAELHENIAELMHLDQDEKALAFASILLATLDIKISLIKDDKRIWSTGLTDFHNEALLDAREQDARRFG